MRWDLWKVAIIAAGVMRRAMDEPRNRAASGTPTAERIDALVAKAHEVADTQVSEPSAAMSWFDDRP
ncbi:hypothetical protein [Streptomyces sp. NPDC001381]|uniref:hypothetical protein n=1 Tax=Streptomyces sp. NPDC001381 TaxID=3364567 RepID=UPI0036820997